jgi:Fe-S cluster assembly protein SufB
MAIGEIATGSERMAIQDLDLSRYKLGWSDAEDYVFKPKKGLSEDIVKEM